MKLGLSLGTVGLGVVISACGVGKDVDVGTDTNHVTGDGGVAGAGSGGHAGSGGATGTGGGATGTGGGATGTGGGATGTGGGATGAGGGATGAGGSEGGVKCGPNTCGVGKYCCNSSCGLCAPMGAACIQIACEPPPTPADAGACVDNVACTKGTVWSPAQCKCVPVAGGGACTTDADCHLVANYCGGCNCDALAPGEKDTCTGEVVQCFADPCLTKTAACVSGQCVAE